MLPIQQLISATELMNPYIENIQIGGIYETMPAGNIKQNNFYNTACIGQTTLAPERLFSKIKYTEKLMGKSEIDIHGPRIIDIDLIFYSDLMYKKKFLCIPHPQSHLRDFVLQPLIDIDATMIHPKLQLPLATLLLNVPQKSILRKVEYNKYE